MEIDLYAFLSGSNSITATVYPSYLSQSAIYPCITIYLIGCERDSCIDHATGIVTKTYQIDTWSNQLDTVIQQAEQVRVLLQGFIGAMGTTTVIYTKLVDESNLHEAPVDGSDKWIFRRMQRFAFKIKETV